VIQTKEPSNSTLVKCSMQWSSLAYCSHHSSHFGRVGLRLVDSGNTVFAGSSNALVVITQLQPITVVFNVRKIISERFKRNFINTNPLLWRLMTGRPKRRWQPAPC